MELAVYGNEAEQQIWPWPRSTISARALGAAVQCINLKTGVDGRRVWRSRRSLPIRHDGEQCGGERPVSIQHGCRRRPSCRRAAF
jgi:hypothetical protein